MWDLLNVRFVEMYFLLRHPSISVERLYQNTESFQESSVSQKAAHPLHNCPVVTITDGLNSNSSFDESPPHSSCEKDPRTPWMIPQKMKRNDPRRGSCGSEGYYTGDTSAVFSCNTAITDVGHVKEDWIIFQLYETMYWCILIQFPNYLCGSYQCKEINS